MDPRDMGSLTSNAYFFVFLDSASGLGSNELNAYAQKDA